MSEDNDWVEYPQKVFDEIKWDAFKKGFFLGVAFCLLVLFVFIAGIISTK